MNDVCPICLDEIEGMEMLACNHKVCSFCLHKLLLGPSIDVDPCLYGCKPCSHVPSCVSRPCSEQDKVVLDEWQTESPADFLDWVMMECSRSKPYKPKKCPICRVEIQELKSITSITQETR